MYDGGELLNEKKEILFRELDKEYTGDNTIAYEEIIKKYSPTQYTLISKIDSDDCIKKDYVELLQNALTLEILPFYYDIENLYMFKHSTKETTKVNVNSIGTTPIISVFKKGTNVMPLNCSHTEVSKFAKGMRVKGMEGLMTIHDGNICTNLLGEKFFVNLNDFSTKL
jgi:hypothetical protein